MLEASPAPELPADSIDAVIAWLVDGARSAAQAQDVLTELCARLVDCDVPLWRVAVYVNTLHPHVMARRFVWRPGEAATVEEASFELANDRNFLASPIARIRASGETIRRRLADPDCPIDFDVLAEMRADGGADYLALPLRFTNGEVHAATFATRQPGGFGEPQVRALERVAPALARVAEVRALRRTAINLLDAYVGRNAGERILAGRIRRGDVETIRAVIWLSDMRGFTKLADSQSPKALMGVLNTFFDCLVPAIEQAGGEVLKFIGDGLLAIFHIGESADVGEVCARALGAAKLAKREIEGLAPVGDAAAPTRLRFGLALHVGEVLYGNIGAGSRVDFTCIGPAVNMAARLEKVAARLGRSIVGSAAFAQRLPEDFAELGAFELAGFRGAETVFGLRDCAD